MAHIVSLLINQASSNLKCKSSVEIKFVGHICVLSENINKQNNVNMVCSKDFPENLNQSTY